MRISHCGSSAERLKQTPRSYADLVPDLVAEIKSSTDRLTCQKARIEEFLKHEARWNGADLSEI
jgi:hypothetical protein